MKAILTFLVTYNITKAMSVIIMVLCFFAWLGQALKDGADI